MPVKRIATNEPVSELAVAVEALPEDDNRVGYLLQAKAELIAWHNTEGQRVKAGEITLEEFRKWQKDEFFPKLNRLHEEYGKVAQAIAEAQKYTIDVTKI